jgi:TPR repeat protein
MEFFVPLSELNQPKPPQAPRPQFMGLFVYAVIGLLIGLVFQEVRWRSSVMVPQGSLAQAEKSFQADDYKTAVASFEKLADKNNPLAQYWVAHMTELGLGVPRNAAKAVELYKKAAQQDVSAAELRLGEIYLNGDIVPPEFVQAKSYLEKAAYHGNPRAAMLLGQMYHDAIGMPADQIEAYAWSEVANLEGNVFAKRERDASFHDLSETDQKGAVARAHEILKSIKNEAPPTSATKSN